MTTMFLKVYITMMATVKDPTQVVGSTRKLKFRDSQQFP